MLQGEMGRDYLNCLSIGADHRGSLRPALNVTGRNPFFNITSGFAAHDLFAAFHSKKKGYLTPGKKAAAHHESVSELPPPMHQ